MTLLRQITIVFTLFFLVMLGIVLAISFHDARDYIENELYTKAQNTASTLAVAMSQEGGDEEKMAVMAEAVYDTGYYRAILLKTLDGREIFSAEREPEERSVVPKWFERLVHLHSQKAVAQVSDGWHPFGVLEVVSDETEAKIYLYNLFNKLVFVFSLATLVALALIALALKMILRPVETMERQAKAVLENRFERNDDLPKTVELRRMADAMNRLVERMKGMHEKLVELTRRNRELEYNDPLTGLCNRRYFLVHYRESLRSDEERPEGVVLAVRLGDLEAANRRIGYDRVNELFRRVAVVAGNIAADREGSVACRISGVEIALLMPGTEPEAAQKAARTILDSAKRFVEEDFGEIRDVVCPVAALVRYDASTTHEKLFASLDLTLQAAQEHGCGVVECADFEESLPTRKVEWRRLIESAIEEGRMQPAFSNIHMTGPDESSARLSFDIVEKEEKIPYRVYGPMLVQLNLLGDYVAYALNHLKSHPELPYRRIALQLPVAFLDTTHELQRLVEGAHALQKVGKELVVEWVQSDLVRHAPAAVETVAENLHRNGIALAIVRFDADRRVLETLKSLRPVYVKMEAGHLLDMSDTLRDSLALLLESVGTRLLVGGVESREELEKLESLGIEFFVV